MDWKCPSPRTPSITHGFKIATAANGQVTGSRARSKSWMPTDGTSERLLTSWAQIFSIVLGTFPVTPGAENIYKVTPSGQIKVAVGVAELNFLHWPQSSPKLSSTL